MVNSTRIEKGSYVYYAPLKLEGTVVEVDKEMNSATVRVEEDYHIELVTLPLADLVIVQDRFRKDRYNQPLTIEIKYFTNDIDPVKVNKKGDWIDLRAAEDIHLKQWESTLIPLGIGMRLPDNYEAHVMPRSSTFRKYGIIQTNSKGLIDNSYSGDEDEWKLPVLAVRDTVIPKNDRICQFRITERMPEINLQTVDRLDEVSRGGFGSTGTQ